MKKLSILFLALVATTALWASNVITYTASEKLPETTDASSFGLHTNAFNVAITSHTFSDGQGIITFDGEVTSISDYAFYYCDLLTSITIPNSVTSIGNWAFENCTALTSIDVDVANTHFSSVDGVLFNNAQDTLIRYPISNPNTKYAIPNTVTCIGNYAFYGCYYLTSLTIPNSVTSIGNWVFIYCYSLTSIDVDAANTHFSSIDGVLFDYAQNTIIQYPAGNLSTEYAIPNTVIYIGYEAFILCYHLTSITIPNSVTSIGEYAFYACSSLADIYTYSTTPPWAYSNAFEDVSKHCYIHVPNGTMRDYQMATGWRDFYHIFEISALPTSQSEVGVTVTNNYATFSWPVNPTASSYTLEIKKDGELFCSLIFNSMGQLVGMNFAPGRGAANTPAAETTTYGYSFVVNGLENDCQYQYTFSSLDKSGNILDSKSGIFSTTGGTPTALDETHRASSTVNRKLLMNGRLLIQQNGRTYTATGQAL